MLFDFLNQNYDRRKSAKILLKNSQTFYHSGIACEPQLSHAWGGGTPEDSQHPVQFARRHCKSGIFYLIDRISYMTIDLVNISTSVNFLHTIFSYEVTMRLLCCGWSFFCDSYTFILYSRKPLSNLNATILPSCNISGEKISI